MIKDEDILLNLKTLTEKVDGISIKAKENIPLVSSEVENVSINIFKFKTIYLFMSNYYEILGVDKNYYRG